MAVYNLDNYLDAKDGLGFPLNFRRGNPNPLDNSSVHATYSDAATYAASDPVAYVGQIISVIFADDAKTIMSPMLYIIKDEAGTLEPIIINIDYDELAFDTSEIVTGATSTTSVLGQAILGQMVLGNLTTNTNHVLGSASLGQIILT